MSGRKKEPLTALQLEILGALRNVKEAKEFCFTGGSALSGYYLRHRVSEDLDFFTPVEKMVQIVSGKLISELEKRGIKSEVTRSFTSFVEFISKFKNESMKVQLALDSPFKLGKARELDGIRVDSLSDISAGKMLALFGRAAERDFVDIFFLVDEGHYSLDEMIQQASKKDPGLDKYFLATAFEQARNLPDKADKLHLNLLKPLNLRKLKMLFIEAAVKLVDEAAKNKNGNK